MARGDTKFYNVTIPQLQNAVVRVEININSKNLADEGQKRYKVHILNQVLNAYLRQRSEQSDASEHPEVTPEDREWVRYGDLKFADSHLFACTT